MEELTFFSSPIGLGHVTRDIAIAKNFKKISPMFVTGSSAAKLLELEGFNVKDLYHPPQFNIKKGILQNPTKWLWNYYSYYKECKKISSNLLQDTDPKLVVSDEDFASLTVAQRKKIPTVVITDILATRFTKGFISFIEKKMNRSMKEIMKKCNYTIIPAFGHDEGNYRYVGPIVRTTEKSREELRKEFSFNKKTIVVSIGGTSAGQFLIEKTLNVFDKPNDEIDLVIVSGPALKLELDNKVRNLGFVKNLHEIVYAADLVISLAGKSTIDETKAYGTPGIFIPIKGHFEQEDNAKEEGCTFEDIYRLDSLISEKLSENRAPLKTAGAKKASEIIVEVLGKSI